jgi:hypothetical protein
MALAHKYVLRTDFVDEVESYFGDDVLPWATATIYAKGQLAPNDYVTSTTWGLFKCKAAHTSGASTEPGVGADWATVWEPWQNGLGVGPAGATGATGPSGPSQICWGRLTLASGDPVPNTDQIAKSTVYFTPYQGDKIGLYNAATWTARTFAELSLDISGVGYTKFTSFDIFAYWTGAAVALESLIWKQVTATNDPTAGATKTINVPDTTGCVVGDWVTVFDGAASEIARVGTVNAGVSIVVDLLANSYTKPTINYNSRGTALILQDGVWVLTGAVDRRYVGTIRIGDTASKTEDSCKNRFLSNTYNRHPRKIYASPVAASWNYGTPTWRPANNDLTARFSYVAGLPDIEVSTKTYAYLIDMGLARGYIGTGKDVITTRTDDLYFSWGGILYVEGTTSSIHDFATTIGFHFMQMMEYASGSYLTFYGAGRSAITGWIMA